MAGYCRREGRLLKSGSQASLMRPEFYHLLQVTALAYKRTLEDGLRIFEERRRQMLEAMQGMGTSGNLTGSGIACQDLGPRDEAAEPE
jgi:hypothetical protein